MLLFLLEDCYISLHGLESPTTVCQALSRRKNSSQRIRL